VLFESPCSLVICLNFNLGAWQKDETGIQKIKRETLRKYFMQAVMQNSNTGLKIFFENQVPCKINLNAKPKMIKHKD